MKKAGLIDKALAMLAQVIRNPKLKKQLLEVMKKASIKKE